MDIETLNASLASPESSNLSGRRSAKIKDHYMILGVGRKASSQEIRFSYFRLKNTYSEGNQALYSIIEDHDVGLANHELEEAFHILSQPELRSEYDKMMVKEGFGTIDDYLAPIPERTPTLPPLAGASSHMGHWEDPEPSAQHSKPIQTATAASVRMKRMADKTADPVLAARIQEMIESGDKGDGLFYKEIRELLGITQEELQVQTKISGAYLVALEENQFSRLPQSVYVKGFLKIYLQYLGISPKNIDLMISQYLVRFTQATESKTLLR